MNKKIKRYLKSKSDDFKNELKRFGKYNLWKFDNKEYEDYYLIGTDDKGKSGLYRMTNYGDTETVFEESRNNTKYKRNFSRC